VFEHDWIDFSKIELVSRQFLPSIVLDDNGDELLRFEVDKREDITFDKIPDVLVKAFLAAEDHKFFSHSGISYKGILRSFLVNLYHMRVKQGASTITQQVAKMMFLTRQRKLVRKIKEVFLAFQLERHLTKEQIFELYVNNVYFGGGIYGVEAASRRFWNKSAIDLSLDEAAILAAIPKSARIYSPLNSIANATKRRNAILKSMILTPKQLDEAINKEVSICDRIVGSSIKLYMQEYIRQFVEQKFGKDILYKNGYKIKTSINKDWQNLAEELFKNKIESLRKVASKNINGGMLSIEPETGKIRVCIGGYDFKESQFNRAFQAVRQMGSAFKPIVYTSAILANLDMDTVMVDEPIEMELPGCPKKWIPRNWTNKFEGEMTLARALSFSNNIVTIKALLNVGIDKVLDLSEKFKIKRSLMPYPSLALGTAEATVEEATSSFNVFANNGFYVKPYMIEWIKDDVGKKICEYEIHKERIIDSITNSKMVNALGLRLNLFKKRYGSKNWIQSEVIGKTGSTNEATTTWYVGASPELTTSIYIGRDDNKPMGKKVFGSQTTFPVWLDFYRRINFTKKNFYIDPSLEEVFIDWNTGKKSKDKNDSDVVAILK